MLDTISQLQYYYFQKGVFHEALKPDRREYTVMTSSWSLGLVREPSVHSHENGDSFLKKVRTDTQDYSVALTHEQWQYMPHTEVHIRSTQVDVHVQKSVFCFRMNLYCYCCGGLCSGGKVFFFCVISEYLLFFLIDTFHFS